MAEKLGKGAGKKPKTKTAAKKAAKKGAEPAQTSLDASPGEQPNLKPGRNSVSPKVKLGFFNEYRIKRAAAEKIQNDYRTADGEAKSVLKRAKAAGVSSFAITEVLKLKKQEIEQVGTDMEDVNEMLVLAGMSVPVRQVAEEVTRYSLQLGLFPDGTTVAGRVDDEAFEAADPKRQAAPEAGGNAKVSSTDIAKARAEGTVAATRGLQSDRNPWLEEDEGHPLRMAWEAARGKQTQEIAARAFGGAKH